MEALVLAATLLTADAEVRQSEAFALAGEVGRFPPGVICAAQKKLVDEHLEWLECRLPQDIDICPSLPWLIEQQTLVREAHVCLAVARGGFPSLYGFGWSEWPFLFWDLSGVDDEALKRKSAGRLRQLIGDDDYFAGRLPAPVTCQRH